MEAFHSGYVGIVGAPNAGKSTLLNRILGEKIAIVTPKPQTTRHRILGIYHHKDGQILFLDSPGLHNPQKKLNEAMILASEEVIEESDLILFMAEAIAARLNITEKALEFVKDVEKPALLVMNKCDLVKREEAEEVASYIKRFRKWEKIIFISAVRGDGVNELIQEILQLLPEGPPYYPEDMITDRPERFIASEIIREKIMELTSDELPYSIAVTVEEFKEKPDIIHIMANIYVERDSQKRIVIGKNGLLLKQIGTIARKELEEILQKKVYLQLWVKVAKKWTKKPGMLRSLGYKVPVNKN